MDEEAAKKWVKNKSNQSKVIHTFFSKNKPTQEKLAFFMAGIPGSGKTEFTENVIRQAMPSLIPIEHDKLVEFIDNYQPEKYYNFRKAGSTLVTCIFEDCLKNGYSFIFDGTLSHESGKRNINKCLKKGYEVIVVYIVQDPKMAWQLTQARELVKKRSIEKVGFIATCKKINPNLLDIFRSHSSDPKFSFWLIDKQGQKDIKKATAIIHNKDLNRTNDIENKLSVDYNVADIERFL